MSFRLRKKESITSAVRRLVREEIDKAIDELKGVASGKPGGLHEARKRIKKLRSLVRLVQSRLDESGKRVVALLREASQPLSGARDAQAMVESFEALMRTMCTPGEAEAFAPVMARLVSRRSAAHESEAQWAGVIASPIESLREIRAISQNWTIRPNGYAAISRGLRRAYQDGVDAMRSAYAKPGDELFHEWRKHVKHHWYHVRLLRGIWPKAMIARAFELGVLSDLLGDDHDLAVMRGLLAGERFDASVDMAALMQMIDDRRRMLRRSARALGQRIFADKPAHLKRRFKVYWEAWHAEDAERADVMGLNEAASEAKGEEAAQAEVDEAAGRASSGGV